MTLLLDPPEQQELQWRRHGFAECSIGEPDEVNTDDDIFDEDDFDDDFDDDFEEEVEDDEFEINDPFELDD